MNNDEASKMFLQTRAKAGAKENNNEINEPIVQAQLVEEVHQETPIKEKETIQQPKANTVKRATAKPLPIKEFVREQLAIIEDKINESKDDIFVDKEDAKKDKFNDVFTSATISVRRDYEDLISNIIERTGKKKYVVWDMIIKKGLHNLFND